MKLTLIAQSTYRHPRDVEQKLFRREIKQKFGVEVRRLDCFTLCGIAAVASLSEEFQQFDQLSLISCAQYFSVELVQQMIIDIDQGKSIKPIDFVTTVGNAANFYIAKEFSIFESNLFLGADVLSLEKTFLVGALELNSNPAQAVILLSWKETEQERICRAFVVRSAIASDSQFKQVNQVSELSDALEAGTPVLVDINTENTIF